MAFSHMTRLVDSVLFCLRAQASKRESLFGPRKYCLNNFVPFFTDSSRLLARGAHKIQNMVAWTEIYSFLRRIYYYYKSSCPLCPPPRSSICIHYVPRKQKAFVLSCKSDHKELSFSVSNLSSVERKETLELT